MGAYDDRPYDVGKGKPPKQHRFKPGVSGNPKGPRHKKKPEEATLSVLVHEALNEMIPVTIGGRTRRLPKKQAIVVGVVNDALTGTPAQRLKALKALRDCGGFEPSVVDDRMTQEIAEQNAVNIINQLIDEGKRDEATRHIFAEYEWPFGNPDQGDLNSSD